jgi:GTP pyrophosphokinase
MPDLNNTNPSHGTANERAHALAIAREVQAGDLNGEQSAQMRHWEAVDRILVDLNCDDRLRSGALLYCLIDAGLLPRDRLQSEFEPELRALVTGVETLSGFGLPEEWRPEMQLPPRQAESLRQMLVAIASDVRLVLVRLADQLVRLQELQNTEPEKARKTALETREIFAPLANRLGVWQIKWQLEDLAFRYLDPDAYRRLAKVLQQSRSERIAYLENFQSTLREALEEEGVSAEVAGRAKHLYSIWRKMQKKHVEVDELFDLRAVRVLVDTVAECYAALGVVHSRWQYIPGEFDDYIATPKENGYRSLHTAVIGPGGHPVEVQIRTRDMHNRAELGVAAHWRYKEGRSQDAAFDQKIQWLRQILEPEDKDETANDLIDRVKSEISEDRVYVISPRGEIVDLPAGSTPLDFAYHVHSEIGHHCRGAKVNGRMVTLTYKLRTGEQVEIVTAKNSSPSRDWLVPQFGYIASPRTRAKVRNWFRRQDQDQNRRQGKAMLEKELGRLGLKAFPLPQLVKLLRTGTAEELYGKIGSGDLSLEAVSDALQQHQGITPDQAPVVIKRKRKPNKGNRFLIAGLGDLLSNPARCCGPMPPEAIRGYLTQGRGVSIHRDNCANLIRLAAKSPERILEVTWEASDADFYPVRIRLEAHDRPGLARDVANILSDENVHIDALEARSDRRDNSAVMELLIEVKGLDQLSRVLNRLSTLPNVTSVNRVEH